MSEMSDMFKLVNQMELAKKARVGMSLTYFDVIELLGEINSLYEYIAELESSQRWIPVSERLPEENQQILSTDGKEFYLDYYARWEGKDKPPCFCDGLSWAVTHWMPLPSVPELPEVK